jgi:hypothetical protein
VFLLQISNDIKLFKEIFEVNKTKHKESFITSDFVIRDSVTISEDAMKKLYEYGEEVAKSKWSDDELKYHSNDFLSTIGKTIEKTGRHMEHMKSISLLAENDQLSEEDRLSLQKKMTLMQSELYVSIYSMSYELANEKYGNKPQMEPSVEIKLDYDLTMKVLTEQENKIKGNSQADIIKDNGDGTYTTEIQDTSFTGLMEDVQAFLKAHKKFSYEVWEENATLSLKDVESSAKATQKLTRQIDALRKRQDDFIRKFKSSEGQIAIEEDIKNPKPPIEGEGGKFKKLKGSVMLSDVRIKHPVGIIEEMYTAWDSFLKGEVYKVLGFANHWDEHLGREIYREMEF